MTRFLTLLAAQTLLLAASAFAQNAVVFGNATTNGGHADGAVYVKGNWSGSNYEANIHNVDETGVYLAGQNKTTNFLRAQRGVSYVGSNAPGSTFDGTLGAADTPDWVYYQGLSANYAAASTGTSANFSDMNNVKLSLAPGLNVFDVNASQLTGNKTVDFTGPAGATVVFNVTGNINSWGLTVNRDPSLVTWNFIDATVVNIDQRNFRGSIIAPNAHVHQYQNIDGTLIAKDWTVYNSVELHNYALVEVPTLIPEPSAMVLAAGFVLLALPRRKR